jgi:hypothetical protein
MSLRPLARPLAAAAAAVLAATALAGCDDVNTVARPAAPVVLTGAQLPDLAGLAPGTIVAFRHARVGDQPQWTQIPVQIDQRKVVGFGTQPANNTTAGVAGTVYGSGSGAITALQYADPNTFVGADTDTTFDTNDELVFMAADAGGKPRDDERTEPAGVVPGSGVAVQVDDSLGTDQQGWVYLFESAGALDPAAGLDYVDYDFVLTSGDYKTTYKRADGPNPETSRVITPTYEIGFTDRWKEVSWKVLASGATGVDLLDAHKNQFAVNYCGRSNATFADGEGAFVANIDGPVRGIRSYIGANSGPLTQRTHLMYRDREDVITDLRVHSIPAMMDFVDFSAAAQGMTYRSSTVPAGVTIDGVQDTVGTPVASWEAVDGPQGQVITTNRFVTSVAGLPAATTQFYRDQTSPPEAQCWGDSSFLGAAGAFIGATIPTTDPVDSGYATLQGRRTVLFAPPSTDPSLIPAVGAAVAAQVDNPLTVSVSAYTAP